MSSYSLKGPDKAFNRKTKAPVLVNVTPAEAESVRSMFKLFDHNSEGHIPNYLARNLMKELGFDVNMLACFAEEVTENEILKLLDQLIPDPDPQKFLEGSLSSFVGMVCHRNNDESGAYDHKEQVMVPNDISKFMESLGRPTPSIGEVTLLLNSMLDYDDCALY